MDLKELEKKLFAVARFSSVGDQVPYAFEKRIMAQIMSGSAIDVWSLWGQLLWKAAAPCLAIMIIMSVWAAVSSPAIPTSSSLAVDLEQAVLAPSLAQLEETW